MKLRTRKRRIAVIILCFGAILCGVYCAARLEIKEQVWRHTRGTRLEPAVTRWCLLDNREPVVRALAAGRINMGDPVDPFVTSYGPFDVTLLGPYQIVRPLGSSSGFGFEGYKVVAKDSRLVSAAWWTCIGSLVFFDGVTEAEWPTIHRLEEEAWDRRNRARRAARMAVAGFAASFDPWDFPTTDAP